MYLFESKLKKVGWVVHCWLRKDSHFVWIEALTKLVDNSINIFLVNPNIILTFLTIKYLQIWSMPSFLIELWATEKSYTAPLQEIWICSSFVKSFDMLV